MTAGSQAAVDKMDKKKMSNLTLKATLSALIVALPVSGAFAQNDRGSVYRTIPLGVDTMTTSSVGAAAAATRGSYTRQLEASLSAAEATALGKGGAAASVRPQIQALRSAVSGESRQNGGELSEASYRSLHGEVQDLHQRIERLPSR